MHLQLVAIDESARSVEAHAVRAIRLEIDRQRLLGGELDQRRQQLPSEATPLQRGLDPEHRQVPVIDDRPQRPQLARHLPPTIHGPSTLVQKTPELSSPGGTRQRVQPRRERNPAPGHPSIVSNDPRFGRLMIVQDQRLQTRTIGAHPTGRPGAMQRQVHRVVPERPRQDLDEVGAVLRIGRLHGVLYHARAMLLRFRATRVRPVLLLLPAVALLGALPSATPGRAAPVARAQGPTEITVFVARQIVTMEPGQPAATAVAVRDGIILDVGSLADFEPWLADLPHRIDRRFARRVLLPGFIDPHIHPFLAGKLLTFDIAAPEPWQLPDRSVPAVTSREAFIERVRALSAAWSDPDRPHVVWGWHRLWHGDFSRADLDRLSPDKALILWHRSYHELVANSKALESIAIPAEELERYGDQIDLARGHFAELGMAAANRALSPILETPERIARGLEIFRALVQRGGVTTVADMLAGGTIGVDREWQASQRQLQGEDVPFRTLFVASPFAWQAEKGETTRALLEQRRGEASDQLRWPRAIKSASDGAFISQLMQLGPPGYLDGHEGEWLIPPALQAASVEPYWKDDWDVYYHVNGDAGLDVVLDLLEALKQDHPRVDYRFSLEHFGVSREDQVERFARLGGSVSVNGYYLHYFGDAYARQGLGFARASQITRLGSLARAGIPFTMHSDCPMGPIEPLLAVSTAVTRETASGRVLGPEQAISVEQALRAITIDAAWSLRLDHEVGSIAPGKRADFAVLEKSPFEVSPRRIREIEIWGTIYEGRAFEAP